MTLSLDTVPASPPDACVTDHPLSRDSLDEPRIGVDGSDFLDWPEVQMWPAGSWLISWFFISRWLADGSF